MFGWSASLSHSDRIGPRPWACRRARRGIKFSDSRPSGRLFCLCVPLYSGITRRECGDIVCFVNAGIDTLTNDLDRGFQLACDGD